MQNGIRDWRTAFLPVNILRVIYLLFFNLFSANATKWQNILKQFAGNLPMNCWMCLTICRRIVWVCLTILWGWRLKGRTIAFLFFDNMSSTNRTPILGKFYWMIFFVCERSFVFFITNKHSENITKQFHLVKLPAPFKDMRNKSITP